MLWWLDLCTNNSDLQILQIPTSLKTTEDSVLVCMNTFLKYCAEYFRRVQLLHPPVIYYQHLLSWCTKYHPEFSLGKLHWPTQSPYKGTGLGGNQAQNTQPHSTAAPWTKPAQLEPDPTFCSETSTVPRGPPAPPALAIYTRWAPAAQSFVEHMAPDLHPERANRHPALNQLLQGLCQGTQTRPVQRQIRPSLLPTWPF